MANEIIREELRGNGIKQWELADALNISVSTMTLWMRHELPASKKNHMLEVIHELAAKKETSDD